MLESSRAKDHAVKQETAEQLEGFRKQRALVEQTLLEKPSDNDASKLGAPVVRNAWTVEKKKRRRDKEIESGGDPKLRKLASFTDHAAQLLHASKDVRSPINPTDDDGVVRQLLASQNKDAPQSVAAGLGLGDYSSDQDD